MNALRTTPAAPEHAPSHPTHDPEVPMPRRIAILLLLLLLLLTATTAVAQVPTTLSYQGRVLDDAGQVVAGPVDVTFSLWSDATGGTELWSESWPGVALSNGVFSVLLGSNGSPLDPSDFQGDSSLFLQLEIDGEVLLPRQALGSAPFALVDEPGNELQDLELAGDLLGLSGSAATVDLSPYLDDTDTDAQDLSLVGNSLGLTNDPTPVDLSAYLDNTDAQTLSLAGDTLTISGSGSSVDLSGVGSEVTGSLNQVPGDPVLVGEAYVGGSGYANGVFVSGRYAYVATDGSPGLRVIDVSDPSSPSLLGSLGIGASNTVFVSGRYAYVGDYASSAFQVVDVSDPTAPSLVGSLGIGPFPISVFVSGRYAYVVDLVSNDLKVIDLSDPGSPTLTGSLGLGGDPRSVFVSGRYAYVVNSVSDDIKVIDVSDPSSPALAGSLPLGAFPLSVFVSGPYAYVLDNGSDELKVIDVSDSSTPALVGSVGVGPSPWSVFVSGRYAYVIDDGSNDLKVIDVSDPSSPTVIGSLGIGDDPTSVFVSGRHAYVVDYVLRDLKVIDVTGAELSSAMVHSLEAGSLQVRESAIVQGQLQVSSGATIGPGGLFSDGNVGVAGTLALANEVAPTSSLANAVQLYAEDTAGSSELKVRDEAGNVTTLSPHNFSLVGSPSEPLAWSYYSENGAGRINVDMLRAMRVVEALSGERLVHAEAADGTPVPSAAEKEASLRGEVEALRQRSDALERENRLLREQIARIQAALGLDPSPPEVP